MSGKDNGHGIEGAGGEGGETGVNVGEDAGGEVGGKPWRGISDGWILREGGWERRPGGQGGKMLIRDMRHGDMASIRVS